MGLNYSSYKMTSQLNTYDAISGQTVRYVDLEPKPGIYLGLITNLKIIDNIDLRFIPSVTLEQRDFVFHMDTTTSSESIVRKKIESSNLNLPLMLKFKSNFYEHYRVYVGIGLMSSINLASNQKVLNNPDLLKTRQFDGSLIAAFGIDLYGEKIKLSPEIRYSLGLSNIYSPLRTRFPTAISDLYSQTIVFSLNFE